MATSDIFNLTDTWNAGATTFTAIKMNVTDTASASASLLMDLQAGGSSKVSVRKDGFTLISGLGLGVGNIYNTGGGLVANTIAGGFNVTSTLSFNNDAILTRAAAASLQLGAADAAAPVAQTLGVQSVVAGTTNTAGANLTIRGSAGTGTGAGGSIIFQVAPAGSSGTAQNAYADALTITSTRMFQFRGEAASSLSFAGEAIYAMNTGATQNKAMLSQYGIRAAADVPIGFSNSTASIGTQDVFLYRDAANTLALRNGTSAQTFRVYGTYNGTNDEWIQLDHGVTSANTATILSTKTGTGVARAIDMQVGTARKIRFSTTGGWEFFNGATREGYFNWDAFAVRSDSYIGFASSTTVLSGQGDTNLTRVGAAIMGIRGSNTTTGGALSFIEQTAPAAPAANGVYIYAEDNGSGKTRLMALFATGAAQQIAIEP